MKDFRIIQSHECPPGTAYVVDPEAAGTLAQWPQVAQAMAEGRTPVVVPNREVEQRVREALKCAGRIDGLGPA